jgi:hypothetical protein
LIVLSHHSQKDWCGGRLLYLPDIVSELRFLFPQAGYSSPETYIPPAGLDDQESSKDYENRTGAEIKNTRQELHDHDADRGKREAGLHIGMHRSLSREKGLFLGKEKLYFFNPVHSR